MSATALTVGRYNYSPIAAKSPQPQKADGFSLIELLVALTIIAILSAIAIPIYNNYLLRAHRVDAMTSITTIALNEEEHRLNNGVYAAALTDLWSQGGNSATTEQGFYNLTLVLLDTDGNTTTEPNNATGFKITATPTGTQINDTACNPIETSVNRGAITKTPEECW